MKNLMFHHIGIASDDMEKDYKAYEILGYTKEGELFTDETQGIKGQFLIAERHPRIELLENLETSHTLDVWLKNSTKMYHLAYYATNFNESINKFVQNRARVITPAKPSVYFGMRICFLMLPNMSMIELIEYPIN